MAKYFLKNGNSSVELEQVTTGGQSTVLRIARDSEQSNGLSKQLMCSCFKTPAPGVDIPTWIQTHQKEIRALMALEGSARVPKCFDFDLSVSQELSDSDLDGLKTTENRFLLYKPDELPVNKRIPYVELSWEGETLSDTLGELSIFQFARASTGLLELFETLKSFNFQHRDIHEKNIAISQNRRHLTLLDFGSVKLEDSNDPNSRPAERPERMPEFGKDEPYYRDVFAFGHVIFQYLKKRGFVHEYEVSGQNSEYRWLVDDRTHVTMDQELLKTVESEPPIQAEVDGMILHVSDSTSGEGRNRTVGYVVIGEEDTVQFEPHFELAKFAQDCLYDQDDFKVRRPNPEQARNRLEQVVKQIVPPVDLSESEQRNFTDLFDLPTLKNVGAAVLAAVATCFLLYGFGFLSSKQGVETQTAESKEEILGAISLIQSDPDEESVIGAIELLKTKNKFEHVAENHIEIYLQNLEDRRLNPLEAKRILEKIAAAQRLSETIRARTFFELGKLYHYHSASFVEKPGEIGSVVRDGRDYFIRAWDSLALGPKNPNGDLPVVSGTSSPKEKEQARKKWIENQKGKFDEWKGSKDDLKLFANVAGYFGDYFQYHDAADWEFTFPHIRAEYCYTITKEIRKRQSGYFDNVDLRFKTERNFVKAISEDKERLNKAESILTIILGENLGSPKDSDAVNAYRSELESKIIRFSPDLQLELLFHLFDPRCGLIDLVDHANEEDREIKRQRFRLIAESLIKELKQTGQHKFYVELASLILDHSNKSKVQEKLQSLELPFWQENDSEPRWTTYEIVKPRLGAGLLWCSLQKKLGTPVSEIKTVGLSFGLPKQTLNNFD